MPCSYVRDRFFVAALKSDKVRTCTVVRTFFFSDLFTTSFSSVFLILVDWHVPGKMAFLHHLLDSVISQPTPETSLAGPDPDPCPEGADKSGICPAPSRHDF